MIVNTTQSLQDALMECARIGARKVGEQLTPLLNDAIQATVMDVFFCDKHRLLNHFSNQPNKLMVGTVQQTIGVFDACVTCLMDSFDETFAISDWSRDVAENGNRLRGLQHDAVVEIAGIVVSSCVASFMALLGEQTLLSLPTYVEFFLHEWLNALVIDKSESRVLLIQMNVDSCLGHLSGQIMLGVSEFYFHELTPGMTVNLLSCIK